MDELLTADARSARVEIVRGALRGAAFAERLTTVPYVDREAWVDLCLGIDPSPMEESELPRGSVPYLPCGVDEILAAVREVSLRADDVFVDLGAGLGRVVIMAHLLTGARGIGIELQASLVRSAKTCSENLELTELTFKHGDAAAVDVEGTVFFLYAPFNGDTLTRVVDRLASVARRKPIVVATVGLELRDVPWLRARTTESVSLSVYDSVRPT
jgi:SAM-dependent methyltransferase